MTRIQLFELAVGTAKANLAENNPIALSNANVQAAQSNAIAPDDFGQFQQYVAQARNQYQQMTRQQLPSEIAATRAAQQAERDKAAAANETPPAKQ